jgi:hypothetical protein
MISRNCGLGIFLSNNPESDFQKIIVLSDEAFQALGNDPGDIRNDLEIEKMIIGLSRVERAVVAEKK